MARFIRHLFTASLPACSVRDPTTVNMIARGGGIGRKE